jgi:hypothetical protein
MSALPQAVYNNQTAPLFYPLYVSSVNVRDIRGGAANFSSIGTAGSFNANSISSALAYISSISTTIITLDGNTLATDGGGFGAELLLNGVPIATASNISSLADWAYDPAISTINANNNNIISANNIGCVNLNATNSVGGVIGAFTTLTSANITNTSNVLTNTLQTTGLINAASVSTPSLKANLISSSAGVFSTLTSPTAVFGSLSTSYISSAAILTGSIGANSGSYSTISVSTITAGSVVFPVEPNLVVSSITVDGATTTQSLSVTSGANFAGTRPNFTTGIVTSGANNFNNNNLDNVGRITANTVFIGSPNYLNTQTSSFTTVLNDRGADVGGNSVINLTAQYGAATRVNITAGQASAYAPTPTSQVNITANGSTSLTNNAVGGRVSLVANAGSGSGTNVLGFGQIDLTAYSSLPYAGVIKESAGSIIAYSGVGTPLVGVYGYSFYSALNCLSLTAGSTVPSGSYPGVVYLRGDNGTKVVNGFYSDSVDVTGTTTTSNVITNTVAAPGSSGIAIQAPTNNISFIASTATFLCGIAGDLSVKSLVNLSSINGVPYVSGGGATVSSFTNLYATNASTTNLLVSSINNAAYPPSGGGGSFVSTATSDLNMNNYNITSPANLNINTGYLHLNGTAEILSAVGSNSVNVYNNLLSVNVDSNDTNLTLYSAPGATGARLASSRGLFLQSGDPASTQTTATFTSTSVDFVQVGGSGYIRRNAAGNIIDTAVGNIQTQATSTINTVVQTVFSGGVSRTLRGVNIQQPIIQYGITSTVGSAGTIIQNLPNSYNSATSYQVFANYIDGIPASLAVSSITRGSFSLSYLGAGGGTQFVSYMTIGL